MNRILRGHLGHAAVFGLGLMAGGLLVLAALAEWWVLWRRDWASWGDTGYEANS